MATTTPNYGWTVPTSTDLVKDGATAIETLGDAVDATVFANASAAIAKTIVDAKGDIIAATASDTVSRLAVGANDTVLTADSTTATGLKWASAGGSATGYTLLNTGGTALSGASTITVSGITKNELMIYVDNASTASGSTTLRFRFNSDSTSKYTTGGMFNKLRATFSGTGATATINGFNDGLNARTEIVFGEIASSGPSTAGGYLNVKGAATTSVKAFLAACGTGADTTGTDAGNYATGGFYTGTSAITTVSLISSSGNFDSGTIYVFERQI